MENIKWLSFIIYLLSGAAIVFTFFVFLLIIIILKLKKRSIKKPIITFLAVITSFSVISGGVAFTDYRKDRWFYEFKSTVKSQHPMIKKIDAFMGRHSLSLSFYYNSPIELEDVAPVFNDIKSYLFDNPSGSNPSHQSYSKRGRNPYQQIYIWFFDDLNDEYAKIHYESGYYADALREKVDNFSTWTVTDENYNTLE